MTLQVIGVGFGRTGTTSLKEALETLGFDKCYHMIEVFKNPGHAQIWDRVRRGESIAWNDLFKGYKAAVDWPVCTFYEELMALNPDAKVILTVRDPERWHKSALETIYRIRDEQRAWLGLLVPGLRGSGEMIDAVIWQGTFGGRFEDRAFAIGIYKQHIENVKQTVPPEKLLVYEVKEGWEPLCAFLGVSVPEGVPFPHANDKAQFDRIFRVIQWLPWVLTGMGVLLGAGVLQLVMRSRR